MTHRTATGHIPAARVVSWGCTCGNGEVLDCADSTPAGWAMAVARGRAAAHALTAQTETERS